jgi:multidrug efflux system membrane fusion protein
MKSRSWLVLGLIVVVGGAAAYHYRYDLSGANDVKAPEKSGSQTAATTNAAKTSGAKKKGAGGPVPIDTVTTTQMDFPNKRRTIGMVESPAVVTLRARIDSQVLTQNVTEGRLVQKGELLFTLDDREVRAQIARDQATLEKDQATLAKSVADLDRTKALIARNVAARTTLDQSIADNKTAAATVAGDQAQLETDQIKLGYTQIKAPIEGRVGTIRVTPGNLVSSSDQTGLVTITQMRPLRVSFTLPQSDLTALREAETRKPAADVRVYASGEQEPLAMGKLNFLDSAVDAASGTITAKAEFANKDLTLWPGQYVDVDLDLSIRKNTVVAPTVAIQTGQKGPYLFVAMPDNKANLRQITIGASDQGKTAILSGLKVGEKVVVEGQSRLEDGTPIKVVNDRATPPAPASEPIASEASAAP